MFRREIDSNTSRHVRPSRKMAFLLMFFLIYLTLFLTLFLNVPFYMVFAFNNIFLDLDFIFFPSCYTLRVSEAASFRSSGFGYFEACPTFPRNGFLVNFVLFSFFLCFNAVFPPCYITKSFVPHICRLFFSSQTISLSKLKTFVCLVFLPSLV